jgi:predicted Zn-dependent protease
VLQSSATGLIVAAITGDIFSASSLAAALSTALIEAQFSRHFEREADDFAMDYLDAHGIPLQFFADLLLRLEQETGGESDEPRTGSRISAYLSTHPVTWERIDRFTQAR